MAASYYVYHNGRIRRTTYTGWFNWKIDMGGCYSVDFHQSLSKSTDGSPTYAVSTVFSGVSYSIEFPPLLFETAAWTNDIEPRRWYSASIGEAKRLHHAVLSQLRRGIPLDNLLSNL